MQINRQTIHACLSLLAAGSMRFRWDEKNIHRDAFFASFTGTNKTVVPLELIHSKIVLAVNSANETKNMQADGIITCNKDLIPVLTVADCMPIFLWDNITGCFGVLHSGWKGTGIVTEALQLANKKYGAKAENFQIVIGPHIKKCCYIVDEERATYFVENFCDECVEVIEDSKSYRLSLEIANMHAIEKCGVKKENVTIIGSCTNCSKGEDNTPLYGSFRRETASFPPNSPLKEMQKHFTPMAAFMCVCEKTLKSTENFLVHTF